MLITIIASVVLAACATFDGYYTYRAQQKGAIETGPARFIYGQHPTRNQLIFIGGSIIAAEIVALALLSKSHPILATTGSLGAFAQSAVHIFGGLSGKKMVD